MCVCANSGLETLSDWREHVEENHLGLFWQALDILTGFKYIEAPTHIFDACLALLLLRLCCSHPPYYDLTDCLDTDPVCHAAYANAESRFNGALILERPIIESLSTTISEEETRMAAMAKTTRMSAQS